jgi:hydrogenase maturation protein HypF
MRPFVYRLACERGLSGWVLNAADGVHVEVFGAASKLDGFVEAIVAQAPPAARIEELSERLMADGASTAQAGDGFEIRASTAPGEAATLVSPDLATCDDCLRELHDQKDRRYHYPFINCTACGPRFTIIDSLPYDRASTSMRGFHMCQRCDTEYHDPADRRFHAQPDACFECGPRLSLHMGGECAFASDRGQSDELIGAAARLIREGKIVAVKSLGGYHLVCDATNEQALARLRERKRRPVRPFAVMAASLDDVRMICQVSDAEADLLQSPARPIVLLRLAEPAASQQAASRQAACQQAASQQEGCPYRHSGLVPESKSAGPGGQQPAGPGDQQAACQQAASQQAASQHAASQQEGSPYRHSGLVPESKAAGPGSQEAASQHAASQQAANLQEGRPYRHSGLVPESKAAGPGSQEASAHGNEWPPVRKSAIAASVAPGLTELGVMLPATPLQHLLMQRLARPLVMTSGNISSEPIIGDEASAHVLLCDVADAFLDNDRPIRSRYDDSVVRVVNGRAQMIRRARGYAPLPLALECASAEAAQAHLPKGSAPVILAAGPEQKSTFCLLDRGRAYVSQHLGDLETVTSFGNYLETIALYEELFGLRPNMLACDMHPGYRASLWAREQGLPRIEVQHHHAHIAAILAENGMAGAEASPVIGIVFDGTGYGDDGAVWGGEALIANAAGYERFAHLEYLPMPGSQAAIIHPSRMAYSLLLRYGLLGHPAASALLEGLGEQQCQLLSRMIETRTNSPMTSSMGRLFDAVSALLGICALETYDGQPAIELEAAIHRDGQAQGQPIAPLDSAYAFKVEPPLISPRQVIQAVLDDMGQGLAAPVIARRFHDAVVRLCLSISELAREARGIETVALGGGVFMNRYLIERAPAVLEQSGFKVLLNKELPANDGCISYGQAAVAAASCRGRT